MFHQRVATCLQTELAANRKAVDVMLALRHLKSRERLQQLRLPRHTYMLPSSSVIGTGSEEADIDADIEANRIIGDEAFSPLWAKLTTFGWKAHKGKGLASWLYSRPGVMIQDKKLYKFEVGERLRADSQIRSAHVFFSSGEVMQFISMNNIDGVKRFGHIDEDYNNNHTTAATKDNHDEDDESESEISIHAFSTMDDDDLTSQETYAAPSVTFPSFGLSCDEVLDVVCCGHISTLHSPYPPTRHFYQYAYIISKHAGC
jgi:hypothetical protein